VGQTALAQLKPGQLGAIQHTHGLFIVMGLIYAQQFVLDQDVRVTGGNKKGRKSKQSMETG